MSLLWQKESKNAGALFIDIFQNIERDHPEEFASMSELNVAVKKIENLGIRRHQKDDSLAVNYRNQGNIKFRQQNMIDAMNLYNRSLCFANAGSENVSLAYANRSACFLHLNMYDKCLADIELATQANYPQRLMEKLHKRRADCLKLKETCVQYEEKVPKLSYEADEQFPALANVLKIECDEQYGRHVVAKSDVEVGQIVLVEEAFISKNLGDEFSSCTICLKRFANFIACDECSNALFCNACASDRSIHKIECDILIDASPTADLIARFMSFGLGAFPIVEDWMEFVMDATKEKLKTVPTTLNDAKSKYRAFLQLINVRLAAKRWNESIVEAYKGYTMILTHKSFKEKFDTERKKRFLMHLSLHHHCVIGCNLVEAFEAEEPRNTTNAFVIQSYLSHSCTPNLVCFERGNRSVGKVLRPIKKGKPLFISYTGDYTGKEPFPDIFGFRCKCERCKPKRRVEISSYFRSDPDYKWLSDEVNKHPNLDIDEDKLLVLQEKGMDLLKRFGHKHWCIGMGITMYGYVRASENLGRKTGFDFSKFK